MNISDGHCWFMLMELSEWAERQGVHYQIAWKLVSEDRMPVPFVKTGSGTILVMDGERDRPRALGVGPVRTGFFA